MLSIALTGLGEARRRIAAVANAVTDESIGDNARAALEPIAEEARRLVRVDSGDLRDSIAVSNTLATQDTNGRTVYVGPLRAGDGGDNSHVFYGHFIEFGTVNHPADPFMTPAVFKHRELVFDVLAIKIKSDIEGVL